MQKTTTPSRKTDFTASNNARNNAPELQPKAETLQRILQFASNYRPEKISDNQYVDIILN